MQESVLNIIQLNLHATLPTPDGASRLVQAMSTWSVETRRARSRHYRDARASGHTTTAMHDSGYSRPSRPHGGRAKVKKVVMK